MRQNYACKHEKAVGADEVRAQCLIVREKTKLCDVYVASEEALVAFIAEKFESEPWTSGCVVKKSFKNSVIADIDRQTDPDNAPMYGFSLSLTFERLDDALRFHVGLNQFLSNGDETFKIAGECRRPRRAVKQLQLRLCFKCGDEL